MPIDQAAVAAQLRTVAVALIRRLRSTASPGMTRLMVRRSWPGPSCSALLTGRRDRWSRAPSAPAGRPGLTPRVRAAAAAGSWSRCSCCRRRTAGRPPGRTGCRRCWNRRRSWKPAGSALAGGTAVHWVPFHCSVTVPSRLMVQTSLALSASTASRLVPWPAASATWYTKVYGTVGRWRMKALRSLRHPACGKRSIKYASHQC